MNVDPNITYSDATRNRIAFIIFIAQSFFSASMIAGFTLSPIIAAELSGSQAAAGFPNTIGLIGRAALAVPFGVLMDRIGRRRALASGYSLSIVGALISMYAVLSGSYVFFLLGALFLGSARSASDQSRYVAAEVFPTASRAKVIGWIVFAGTVGAIGGPLLVKPSGIWLAQLGVEPSLAEFAGPFAIASVAMLIGVLVVIIFMRPDPLLLGRQVARAEAAADESSVENSDEVRTLAQIFSAPSVQLALIAMVLGYFVMTFMMVITPLHMSNNGHGTGTISGVIMAHTLGMFGLSWMTGSLIGRFGRIKMIYAGCVLLFGAAVIGPISTAAIPLGAALFMLGLGWNFAFVSGSSLLANSVSTSERARVQSVGEVVVALSSGGASFAVGSVYQSGGSNGYLAIGSIVFVITLILSIANTVLPRRDKAFSLAEAAAGD